MPKAVSERPSRWRRLQSRRVVVHDESMAPTLLPGDRLLVDRDAYRDRSPTPGDIVVFVDPETPTRWLIKRVAGVGPGRFWKTREGLRPAPAESTAEEVPPSDSIEAIVLEPSAVYVAGDSETARDSRQFGPIPISSLLGRAYQCYAPVHRRRDL